MRKIILCFLLVFLFMSVLSFAFADNPFLGLWVDTNYSLSSDYQYITAISIRENGKAFFVSDKFYDFDPQGMSDLRVYDWSIDENKITLKNTETGESFWELYLFETDKRYLSFFESGQFERFQHVPYIFIEKEPSPASVSTSDGPVGKWSFFWDARNLVDSHGKKVMSFDMLSYDLYLFDDGSAYLTNMDYKDGQPDFSFGALSGVWLNVGSEIKIKVGSSSMNATLSNDGRLFVYMNNNTSAWIFNKTPLYNYLEGIKE